MRLGSYVEPLRQWILDTKYDRWSEMALALGVMLGDAVRAAEAFDPQRTILVPIPMPWPRRMYRGIDHAALIADGCGRVLRCEVHRVLAKSNGPLQTSLTSSERKQRRKGWMRVRRRPGGWRLSGHTVVLIDDVRTTGTTLRIAARLLKSLGASQVVAAVVAVADSPGRRPAALSQAGIADDGIAREQSESAASDPQRASKSLPILEVKARRVNVEVNSAREAP